MSKICLIYANCQGRALGHFLNQSPFFSADYRIEYLINYEMIGQKKTLPVDRLQKAALLIHQPIEKRGIYSTDNILTHLSGACIKLSFPYLFNDALWPFFRAETKMVNAEPILDLLAAGATPIEIALKFLTRKIDFQFQRRFQNTIDILAAKEAITDVKAVPYILENFRTQKLFLTHNHPSSHLLIHCTNQILSRLGYPPLQVKTIHPNAAELPGHYPMSPYEKAHYQLAYEDDWRHFYTHQRQNDWRRAYLFRIMEICLARHPEKTFRYHYEKLSLKLLRSLVQYL